MHCNGIERLRKLDSVAGFRGFLSAFGYCLALFLSYMIVGQPAANQIAMRLFIWAEESATLRALKRHKCPTEATE
jgi:hypothetical protein